jgi:hypothetical protein
MKTGGYAGQQKKQRADHDLQAAPLPALNGFQHFKCSGSCNVQVSVANWPLNRQIMSRAHSPKLSHCEWYLHCHASYTLCYIAVAVNTCTP